ncbi:MAG: hypothetical protein KIC73_00545 [Clostridiales bacterium]|nr:hypothetical protein [Clostridiales bacterium]
MASISPDMYREELKKCNTFIKEVDGFMNTNWAILLDDNVSKMVKEGNILQGRMEVFKEGLVANSNREPKYATMLNTIIAKIEELEKYCKEYGVKNI